jgi:precorrin-2/cobalt-factor-2 C20-methyltransferase
MKTILYGIGVGPGDPDLLTIKGKKIINQVDCLILPVKKIGDKSFAHEIIGEHLENPGVECIEMLFPMHYNQEEFKVQWAKNAKQIEAYMGQGKTCGFITLGDPTLYSTFIYLLSYLELSEDQLEIVPGITSYSALASTLKTPLTKWQEDLRIVPLQRHDQAHIMAMLENGDNFILMKPQACTQALIGALQALNLEKSFRVISYIGRENQEIIDDIEVLKTRKLPYLSTMLIKKGGFDD